MVSRVDSCREHHAGREEDTGAGIRLERRETNLHATGRVGGEKNCESPEARIKDAEFVSRRLKVQGTGNRKL